jgi:O-antigen ligase
MFAELKKLKYPVETGLLFILCLSLPLFEAPKNLAWLAYCVAWIVNRVRARDAGGPWTYWDTLFAAWIASGFVVAAFAGLHRAEWGGATDLLRYGSVLWLVSRAGYSRRVLRWLLGALVASTLAGLAYGYARLWGGYAKSGFLQLHSVGHVNHTAIYIAIMLGVCTAWIFARWQAWPAGRRATGVAIGVFMLVSLVVTQSRGAVGAGVALVPILALAWWPRWRAPLIASFAALAITVALAVGFGAEIVRKQQDREKEANVLAFRDGMWRSALAAWEKYPWFGVGMDNYSGITRERLKAWREEAGKPYEPSQFITFPHGHSLYLNTLAERGIAGSVALALVLLAWLVALVRWRPRSQDRDHDWLLWGSAASAWLVTVGAGLVNTTLHHEHGILAVLLLGLWLASRRAS